jgi:very-short-patch-repair endonuclease
MHSRYDLRRFSRRMKREPTAHEALFERRLIDAGIPYKKQVILGFYILDFVLPDRLLCIELDGRQHGGEYDRKRDEFIRKCGLDVLRIRNGEAASYPVESLIVGIPHSASAFLSVHARSRAYRGVALRACPSSQELRNDANGTSTLSFSDLTT